MNGVSKQASGRVWHAGRIKQEEYARKVTGTSKGRGQDADCSTVYVRSKYERGVCE